MSKLTTKSRTKLSSSEDEMFNQDDVTFRIGNNFGKLCLLAEYKLRASTALEIDPSDTLESLSSEFPAMIEDIKKQLDIYSKK